MTASAGKWMEHLRVIMLRETGQSHKTSSRHFPSCGEAMTETGERARKNEAGMQETVQGIEDQQLEVRKEGARKRREMSNRQNRYY